MLNYHAAALVGKIHDQTQKLIVSELEKQGVEGIVPSHGGILMFLYQQDGQSIKELTEKINRTQPTLTVLVNKLEQFGYVERKKGAEDSRVTLIFLTEKSRRLEPIFRDISAKLNEAIYGSLNEQESEQLERLLEKVLKRL